MIPPPDGAIDGPHPSGPLSESKPERQWFAVALASIGDGVIAADVHGRITFMNPVAEALTGWTAREGVGQPLEQVFRICNEETQAAVENPALRAIREGLIFGLANHTLLIAKDGRKIAIDDSGAPIRTDSGECLGAVLVFRDVTEQRQADEARALLAGIVNSSEDAIISKNLDGIITSWNAAAERLFGYPATEAIGQSITLIIPPERDDEEATILSRLKRGERIEHLETDRVAKDGRRVPIALTVSPVRNRYGAVAGASKIARDISARKYIEDVLRASQARLTADAVALVRLNALSSRLWQLRSLREGLEEMLAAMVELMGADLGNIQLLDAQRDVLEIAAQRGFERDFLEFFREVSTKDASACARALRAGERIVIEDIEADEPYAPLRDVARRAGYRGVQSTPLMGRDRTPLGMISTHWRTVHRPTDSELSRLDLYVRQASDFIARCRMEEALEAGHERLRMALEAEREALAQADAANHAKDQFLARVSHELRTPLNTLMGWARMLRDEQLPPDRAPRALAAIDRNGEVLKTLVEDLVEMSRIQAGKLQFERRHLDILAIVRESVNLLDPAATAKNIRVEMDMELEPIVVNGDPIRLRQVFWNLISNALKFTPSEGRVMVHVRLTGGEVQITVADTGQGIAPEFLPHVFEAFAQGGVGDGRGLGLAIVDQLVKAHDGRISAASPGVGAGATLTVFLPVARAPENV